MKKALFLLLFFSVNSMALVDNKMLNVCDDQANSFGDGKGISKIQSTCVAAYKTAASLEATKKSQDGTMTVFGHRSIIFIERPSKDGGLRTDVIAGQSTGLEAIAAVSIDEKNNEIAVLEKSGDILFFSSQITGNVAPYRQIKTQDLFGASEIAIDWTNDQVLVINNTKNSILFYSRLANIHAREEKKNLTILKTIKDTSGNLKDLSLNHKDQEFSVLDQTSNKILTYKLGK